MEGSVLTTDYMRLLSKLVNFVVLKFWRSKMRRNSFSICQLVVNIDQFFDTRMFVGRVGCIIKSPTFAGLYSIAVNCNRHVGKLIVCKYLIVSNNPVR